MNGSWKRRRSCGNKICVKKALAKLFWFLVALTCGWAYAVLATHRGEGLKSVYLLTAALCSYAIGYRFYSKWIAARVLMLQDRRATPCEVHDDGKDFVRTNKWIVFGQHFAAISGPGPLVGPVLAAQFGYLPSTLWILIGVTLGGAVQDFVVLFCSLRRDGKSLGQMVKEELNTPAGALSLVAILAILVILLAVLALVVVKALAESPWGAFTVGATIPIALFMGCYLRFLRIGRVREASVIGVILLLLAVWGGKLVHETPSWAAVFGLRELPLALGIIVYGLAASTLPVWLLLAPRGYLSTFMKLGTIFALALGIFLVLPDLKMPPVTTFVNGTGLIISGKVFPFCFITIACGAISGFHTLIASGTTPKLLTRESYARPVGYGAMCLESLVAIMALIAACTLDQGVYFGMNVPSTGTDAPAQSASITERLHRAGSDVTVSSQAMEQLASEVHERTLFNRTGGAATLAAGMANIFAKVTQGRWVDLWYHFAIMFEALFILTTIDAGTRVGRYLLQEVLGNIWKPLGDTKRTGANLLASGLMVAGWGYFLIQGVRDPLGGINSLWPLFGIANQMLAAIALCLATTILLKMHLQPAIPAADDSIPTNIQHRPNAAFALIVLLPLIWLLAVTLTAGEQKIFDKRANIGFLAAASGYKHQLEMLERTSSHVEMLPAPQQQAEKTRLLGERHRLETLRANNLLDALVTGVFLALILGILALSIREWFLLLAKRKPPLLHETKPVWLPDYAIVEPRPLRLASLLALAFGLSKELSGEGHLERAQQAQTVCEACDSHHAASSAVNTRLGTKGQRYAEATDQTFRGIRSCC